MIFGSIDLLRRANEKVDKGTSDLEMQQEFLNLSFETWNVFFLVIRYVIVALILAYLANVYVKRKDIQTDIKGRALEWRVDTYKSIHRWVLRFQNVIVLPSQYEDHYRIILASTKFKIGYNGMEYASFFDSPKHLFQFGIEFNRLKNKEENVIDYPLKHQLNGFQYWLDDVIMFYEAFNHAECDKRWKFDEKTIKKHCELACKALGIALQKDVNNFYENIDNMLRDRLRNLKIAGVFTESWWESLKRKMTEYCEAILEREEDTFYCRSVEWLYYNVLYSTYSCSQLQKNQLGLMKIFMFVHFEDLFVKNPVIMKDKEEIGKLTTEFYDCYIQYLRK